MIYPGTGDDNGNGLLAYRLGAFGTSPDTLGGRAQEEEGGDIKCNDYTRLPYRLAAVGVGSGASITEGDGRRPSTEGCERVQGNGGIAMITKEDGKKGGGWDRNFKQTYSLSQYGVY